MKKKLHKKPLFKSAQIARLIIASRSGTPEEISDYIDFFNRKKEKVMIFEFSGIHLTFFLASSRSDDEIELLMDSLLTAPAFDGNPFFTPASIARIIASKRSPSEIQLLVNTLSVKQNSSQGLLFTGQQIANSDWFPVLDSETLITEGNRLMDMKTDEGMMVFAGGDIVKFITQKRGAIPIESLTISPRSLIGGMHSQKQFVSSGYGLPDRRQILVGRQRELTLEDRELLFDS